METTADEGALVNSLLWSKLKYSLAEFTDQYPLPQVVCVVDGYYSTVEEHCFGSNQVLALHEKTNAQKIIGTDSFDKTVTFAAKCPNRAHVCLLKHKLDSCTPRELKSLYPKISFVKVENVDDVENDEGVTVGDLLAIQKIDKKKKEVHLQKVDTKQVVLLSYSTKVTFTPLLDWKDYSVLEVARIFGFPTRVSFLKEKTHGVKRKQARSNCHGEVILNKEVTQNIVIATTVGDESTEKRCIGLPVDLPLHFAVAEGFTKGDGNYEEIVRTLNTNYKHTILADFDLLNVSKHLDAVRTFDQETPSMTSLPSQSLPRKPSWRLSKLSTKSTDKFISQAKQELQKKSDTLPTQKLANKGTTSNFYDIVEDTGRTYELPTKLAGSQTGGNEDNGEGGDGHYVEMQGLRKGNVGEYENPGKRGNTKNEKTVKAPVIPPRRESSKRGKDHEGKASPKKESVLQKPCFEETRVGNKERETETYDDVVNIKIGTMKQTTLTIDEVKKGQTCLTTFTSTTPVSTLPSSNFKAATSQRNPVTFKGTNSKNTSQNATNINPEIPQGISNLPNPEINTKAMQTNEIELQKMSSEVLHSAQSSTDEPKTKVSNDDNYKKIALVSEDISRLSVNDIGHVLRCLNMACYVEVFEQEMIDGDILKDLDLETLQTLNVTLFHGKKLLKFINGWRPKK